MSNGHAFQCDYRQTPIPPDPECYCPTAAEEASRLSCGHMPEIACWCVELDEEDW